MDRYDQNMLYTGGNTIQMATRRPGAITTVPPRKAVAAEVTVKAGAWILTAAIAVRLIVGESIVIDAGVIEIELNPKHTLSVIPCNVFVVCMPKSRSIFWLPIWRLTF